MENNKQDTPDIEFCTCNHKHKEVISRAMSHMVSDDDIYEMSELFKVFGDSTRVRILAGLFQEELCVCDIADLLNMTKSAISHQLRVLRTAKLVKARKEGKEVFYSLADDHVKEIFEMTLEHIHE